MELVIRGARVATVTHQRRSMMSHNDKYVIAVQPNVDLAFVALVVIVIDELYHD